MEMKDALPSDRERPPKGQKWANEGVITSALVDLAILKQIPEHEVTLFETTKELKKDTLEKLQNYVAEEVQGRVNSLSRFSSALEASLTSLEHDHRRMVMYELRGETIEGDLFERSLEEVKSDFIKINWGSVNGLKVAMRRLQKDMVQQMMDLIVDNQRLSNANVKLMQAPQNLPWYKRIFKRKTKP